MDSPNPASESFVMKTRAFANKVHRLGLRFYHDKSERSCRWIQTLDASKPGGLGVRGFGSGPFLKLASTYYHPFKKPL